MTQPLAVIGLGYVGCVTAACLARHYRVIGVDRDANKVESIRNGKAPFYEPGLDNLLQQAQQRLHVTTNLEEAAGCSHYFICVGTPTPPNQPPDLTALHRVIEQMLQCFDHPNATIVVRSTVPPGTTAQLPRPYSWSVVHNPEFLREGCAIEDFTTEPLVVLAGNPAAVLPVATIYHNVTEDPNVYFMQRTVDSEMLKYACNAYHATKIVFANEIGLLCSQLGADPNTVMEALRCDTRLNTSGAYLRPGFAFGGSCLPKDLRALAQMSESARSTQFAFMDTLLDCNTALIDEAASLIAERAETLGVPVTLFGASFKSGTEDERESPALLLADALRTLGVPVEVLRLWPTQPGASTLKTLGVITYHTPGWEHAEAACEYFVDLSVMPWSIVSQQRKGSHSAH